MCVSVTQRINFFEWNWAPVLLAALLHAFWLWFSRFRFHSSLSTAHCDVPQLLLPSIFPFSLSLSFTTHPLAEEAFRSFPSYWILGRLYWSFSASPLSPSRQLHVEAPFSPMRDSRMNRRAYWGKERESQSLLFVSLNIFYGLPLSPLPVLNSSVTNTAFSCCSFCLLCERGCCCYGIVVDTDNMEREDFFCTSYFKKYIIKPKHDFWFSSQLQRATGCCKISFCLSPPQRTVILDSPTASFYFCFELLQGLASYLYKYVLKYRLISLLN